MVWALGTPPSSDRDIIARAYERCSRLESGGIPEVIGALERLGARVAADEMHDRALAEADEIAGRAALDRENAIRNFLARGARRVA